MTRYYLLPKVFGNVMNRPAYVRDLNITFTGQDYASSYFIKAEVTPEQHQELASHDDVYAFPPDPKATFGTLNSVKKVRAELNNRGLPGDWLDTTIKVREAVETVFQFIKAQQILGQTHGSD